MKKLGNLSLLALLAMGFALVFGGCRSDVGGILASMGTIDQENSGGDAAVTGVKLAPATQTVKIGETVQLKATVEPSDAANKSVTWKSSDDAIATVDKDGNVMGVAAGLAYITVTTAEGNFSDTSEVSVLEPGKVISRIGVGGDTGFTFADLEVTENYNSPSLIKKNEDGTLTVTAGSWDTFNIELPERIDISGKKIAITAKVASGYTQVGSLFKLIFAESDDNQSEITANEVNNKGWCDPLTTEFKTYTGSDIWTAYEKEESADLRYIKTVIINPQSGTGEITIQSIAFVEGDGNEGNPGDSGSSGGQTGGEDPENPDDPNAPKTKFTNPTWNTAIKDPYNGVFIDVSSIDYPENFDFSEYDFLKVNVTFSKGGEEVTTLWSTGFAHLQKENGDNLLTIQNINNGVSSKYNSAWFPIAMLKEVPTQLAVQSAVGGDEIDFVTVNYIEFVKIEGLKKGVENNVASIVNSGKTGDKVVFAVVYDTFVASNNGIGWIQLPDAPWTASDVTFLSDGNVEPGYIQEIEKSYDEVKTASDAGYTGLAFFNGAFLQYVYIK